MRNGLKSQRKKRLGTPQGKLAPGILSLSRMQGSCQEISELLKALSHPERLLVLGRLAQGPRSVSELVEASGASQPQMSQFLSRLKREGLVQCESRGRFRVYSLADARLARLLRVIQEEYCGG